MRRDAYATLQVLHEQTEASIDEFDKECTTMRMARHPNVVRMLGLCTEDKDGAMCLLMEFCLLGDLRRYLLQRVKVSIVDLIFLVMLRSYLVPRVVVTVMLGAASETLNAL